MKITAKNIENKNAAQARNTHTHTHKKVDRTWKPAIYGAAAILILRTTFLATVWIELICVLAAKAQTWEA